MAQGDAMDAARRPVAEAKANQDLGQNGDLVADSF